MSDIIFMQRALELAEKGRGTVSPNPMVGAVAVKDGVTIAEGAHLEFGGNHAEVNLLKQAQRKGISLKGANIFLTLEPCCHDDKKTPPCVPLLIASGVKKVFVAMKDPNSLVNGRGAAYLKKNGIKIEFGLLGEEARRLNEKYCHFMETGMPFVGMKIAMSLDGKIATRTKQSKWISCEESRKYVHELRDEYDAILVGRGTAVCDNPHLAGVKRQPVRVLLDSNLVTPLSSHIFRDANVVVATTQNAPSARQEALQKRGVILKIFPNKIQLPSLLRFLAIKGISSVLVEGGGEVFGSFVDERLVNRIYICISPLIIGGRDAMPAVCGIGINMLRNAVTVKSITIRQIGRDYFFSGSVG